MPATILRLAYFMQNDGQVKTVIEEYGVYPMPIGNTGVWIVDVRDIADIAAAELLSRHHADYVLPGRTLELAGPEALTGEMAAGIWSEALQRPISYGGDGLDDLEQQLRAHGPDWLAYDMRLMMARIQQHGMHPKNGATEILEKILGRPLRSYRDLVAELLGSGHALAED